MAHLVQLSDRIINLDQLVFAERKQEGQEVVVTLFFHEVQAWKEAVGLGTKEKHALNMSCTGADAEFIWKKLAGIAESWTMPDVGPGQGFLRLG